MVEDVVVGENRVQRYTEQEVLQPDSAAFHKVRVHVVSGQLVPHELSLHTNTPDTRLQSFIYSFG